MRTVLLQAGSVLAAAAGVRFGLPALARLASRALDPALRAWVDQSERSAGPYVHLSRGLSHPRHAGLPAEARPLTVDAAGARRAVA